MHSSDDGCTSYKIKSLIMKPTTRRCWRRGLISETIIRKKKRMKRLRRRRNRDDYEKFEDEYYHNATNQQQQQQQQPITSASSRTAETTDSSSATPSVETTCDSITCFVLLLCVIKSTAIRFYTALQY